ncbi:MAG TPA: S8 family serine peptidase, partial [Patescibacteria group bacterium]|nr:S8 family serine peptidase [Patescibacteria group bacterium]
AGASGAKIRWGSRSARWQVVTLADTTTADEIANRLASDASVKSVERDNDAVISGMTPNDLMVAQWGLNNAGQSVGGAAGVYDADIDAPEAWELSRGDSSVMVAVLDTGVRADHPDLGDNLIRGYDFVNGDDDPSDDFGAGHGTPVAGIIGAVGDNGTGMTGINWSVSLLPVKVCDAGGRCPYSSIISGIEYAVAHGAKVLNLSLSCDEHQDPATGSCAASRPGACRSEALFDALDAAREAGVLAVVAAGNCGQDIDDETKAYPCAFDLDNVLCVGATDSRDELASFSNYGPRHVRLAAPGSRVLSLGADVDSTLLWDGTSFSAPMAAGVAALQLARNNTLSARALAARVSAGDTLASLDGLIGGAKRLNARTAVQDLFLTPRLISRSGGAGLNLTGDFDGDGRLDACVAGVSTGHRVGLGSGAEIGELRLWSDDPASGAELVGDVDGDGRDDIVRQAGSGIKVMRSTGIGFAPAKTWTTSAWKGSTNLADVDGDGRDDLVRSLGDKGFWVSLSTGESFARPTRWSPVGPGSARVFADFNGDGRSDMLRSVRGVFEVSLSTGVSFSTPVIWGPGSAGSGMQAGDLDGDGRADLLRQESAGGMCWEAMLSDGASLSSARAWGCPEGCAVVRGGAPVRRRCQSAAGGWMLGDFNGDGRADLVEVGLDSGWKTMLSSH